MTRKIHDTDYLFLTTRVRALEGCLLNRGQMEQMLEAGSPEEAARILTDCGYPELETVSAITVGEMLNRERERLFQDLAELVPDPAILAVFQLPHDYHNVKVLLKSEAMGIQEGQAWWMPAVFRRSSWSLRCGRERFQNLPPQLGEAIDEARQVLSATRDPQLGDMVLDRRYFQELLVLAEETGSLFLQGYVQRMIDAANLRTASPCSPYGAGDGIPWRESFSRRGRHGGGAAFDRDQWRKYAGGIVCFLPPGTGCGIRSYGGPWRFLDTIRKGL